MATLAREKGGESTVAVDGGGVSERVKDRTREIIKKDE